VHAQPAQPRRQDRHHRVPTARPVEFASPACRIDNAPGPQCLAGRLEGAGNGRGRIAGNRGG
jgi:hypothetical protein